MAMAKILQQTLRRRYGGGRSFAEVCAAAYPQLAPAEQARLSFIAAQLGLSRDDDDALAHDDLERACEAFLSGLAPAPRGWDAFRVLELFGRGLLLMLGCYAFAQDTSLWGQFIAFALPLPLFLYLRYLRPPAPTSRIWLLIVTVSFYAFLPGLLAGNLFLPLGVVIFCVAILL